MINLGFFFLLVCVRIYTCGYMCAMVCLEVRGQQRNQFSPSTMWVPGTICVIGLGGRCFDLLSHLISPLIQF